MGHTRRCCKSGATFAKSGLMEIAIWLWLKIPIHEISYKVCICQNFLKKMWLVLRFECLILTKLKLPGAFSAKPSKVCNYVFATTHWTMYMFPFEDRLIIIWKGLAHFVTQLIIIAPLLCRAVNYTKWFIDVK